MRERERKSERKRRKGRERRKEFCPEFCLRAAVTERRPRRCIQTTISLVALKTSVNRDKSGERGVQRPVDSQTGGRGPDQCITPLGAVRGIDSARMKERERE